MEGGEGLSANKTKVSFSKGATMKSTVSQRKDGITTTKPTNKWKLYDGWILWFSLMSEEGGVKPGQEPIPKGMLRCYFGVMQPFLQVHIRMSFLLYHKSFKE